MYDGLTLAGGGIRGIIQLGILHYYYISGDFSIENITSISGTSIGSVLGLLLNVGYTPIDTLREILNISNLTSMGEISTFREMYTHLGLMNINKFLENISNLLVKKLGKVPTFEELYNLTRVKLYIITTNADLMSEEAFSVSNAPNMSVLLAVSMSCNLPGIFHAITHNSYRFVDGGLTNNFPWNYISGECKNILGVIVRGDAFTFGNEKIDYFYKLVQIPINTITRLRVDTAPDNINVVNVNYGGLGILTFELTYRQKMEMFLIGVEYARRHQESVVLEY